MAGLPNAEKFVEFQTGVPLCLADTVSSDFQPSGPNAAKGLVPAPPSTPGATLFLREDGIWAAPIGATGSITNAMLASMPEATIKGRAVGAGDGSPQDLTASEATAILNIFVSASAGKKGLVPAPTTSDVGKVLGATGWETPSSGLTRLVGASISSSTSVVSIDLSSFSGYSEIYVQLYGIRSNASAEDVLYCQFSSNGTAFTSASYEYSLYTLQSSFTVENANTQSAIRISGQTAGRRFSSSVGNGLDGKLNVIGPYNSNISPSIIYESVYVNGSGAPRLMVSKGGAIYYTAMEVNGIALFCSASTFLSGVYEVYGYASA